MPFALSLSKGKPGRVGTNLCPRGNITRSVGIKYVPTLQNPYFTLGTISRRFARMSDEEQIRSLVETWRVATQAGDIDTVLGLMTDDVVFLVYGRPPMNKAEFAALSRVPPGSPRPKFEGRSEIQEIYVSGDLAYMWSKLTVSVTPAGAEQPTERAGHTLTIFRRIGGRWLLARDANLLAPAR